MKKLSRSIRSAMAEFMKTVLAVAKREKNVIMPAFTHLQAAQPVSMAHYLLSWFWMVERDYSRFVDCEKRFDVMPLASGALAGSGFAIDRELLRKELGFATVSDNSMDAVADRDYLIEFLSACSIASMHLSRFAEDVIIFCSPGYRYLELSDAYSTGSSMMPNKKNPDSMELVRGKTGRIFGALTTLLTITKGLPLTYNKDLQEDKEPVFDSAETLISLLKIFTGVIESMKVNAEKIAESLPSDMLATDLADILVENGLPFRDAHEVVGRVVLDSTRTGKKLIDYTYHELSVFSKAFPKNVKLSFAGSIERRNVYGGTGSASVEAQLKKAKGIVAKCLK
jgi:argininosuccinate lyase